MTLRNATALVVLISLLAGGCTLSDQSRADRDVPVRSRAEMVAAAERHAREIVEWLGSPQVTQQGPTTNVSACYDPSGNEAGKGGPRNVYHALNVVVGKQQQGAALERAQQEMRSRGYEISDSGLAASGGRFAARSPEDGYKFRISSTSPPTEITIWIFSPCFSETTPSSAAGASAKAAGAAGAVDASARPPAIRDVLG